VARELLVRRLVKALRMSALAALVGASQASFGDPPPSTPPHDSRAKNDPSYYVGYTGRGWERDYGVIDGYCNRAAVVAAVGSTIDRGDGRAVAIVAGEVLGAVIGAPIGRDIDDADRGCVGQALELTPDGRAVRWTNPQTGARYVVTPLQGYKSGESSCREFRTVVILNDRTQAVVKRACRRGDGLWRIGA